MRIQKKAVAFGIVGGVLALAGVAFAAWNAGGAGRGSAQALSAVDLTTSVATPVAGLYPGGSANLSITVNNPNPYPVSVITVEPDPDNAIAVDTAGCDAGNVSLVITGGSFTTTPGVLAVPVGIPAKVGSTNGTSPITLTNAVKMIDDADDACQGAVFSVPVVVTGASAADSTP